MKKILMLIIVLMLTLIVSCGKKSEDGVFSNSDKPSDPAATLNLKKLFTISSENQTDTAAYLKMPLSLTTNKNGDIYILDVRDMNVKKFDSEGNYIKSIGRSGQGPGEFINPIVMFIENDTLNVTSVQPPKLVKFDLDGNFYYEKHIGLVQLQSLRMSRNGEHIASYVQKVMMKEGTMPDIEFSLAVIETDSLKAKSVLRSKTFSVNEIIQGKLDYNDLIIPFVPGDEFIYVSENSDNQYRILAYDYEGNKKFEIRKDYKMIRYTPEEKQKYLDEMKKNTQGTQEIKIGNFKKAISSMHTDKYGRLLVVPNVDRNLDSTGVYVDIFKDGKFLNRADYSEVQDKEAVGLMKMFSNQEFYIGDRLYVLSMEDLSIDVYEY